MNWDIIEEFSMYVLIFFIPAKDSSIVAFSDSMLMGYVEVSFNHILYEEIQWI